MACDVLMKLLVVAVLFASNAFAKHDLPDDKVHSTKDTASDKLPAEVKASSTVDHALDARKIYQQLLRSKIAEQHASVQGLIAAKDAKKVKRVIEEIVKTIRRVLSSARAHIEKEDFNAPGSQFPAEAALRESVANVVENTAFFGELALYFPQLMENMYQPDAELKNLIAWAYDFTSSMGLYDDAANKMLRLAGQELNIIERDENYVNPYSKLHMREELQRAAVEEMRQAQEKKQNEKKQEQKKKRKSEPRLSKSEL